MSVSVGVLGCGVMGTHHARVYGRLPCELAGVYDLDPERALLLAEQHDTLVCADINDLFARCDAVSICTPTNLHVPQALEATAAGCDVLIEKPLAPDEAQAEWLRKAVSGGRIVQVGHIEHFNPAVRMAAEILREEELIALDFQRLSPVSRGDGDVVSDLMLHDLHVLRVLAGPRRLTRVQGVKSRGGDHVAALLQFEDGLIATLTASYVTERKIRRFTATTCQSYLEVDYQQRTVERSNHTRYQDLGGRAWREESRHSRITVPIEEPLEAELRHFLGCVGSRREPEVDLVEGTLAMQLVAMVQRAVD